MHVWKIQSPGNRRLFPLFLLHRKVSQYLETADHFFNNFIPFKKCHLCLSSKSWIWLKLPSLPWLGECSCFLWGGHSGDNGLSGPHPVIQRLSVCILCSSQQLNAQNSSAVAYSCLQAIELAEADVIHCW